MQTSNDTLTAVPGFRVGHATDEAGLTGCTVVLCPPGTAGGVDQRGGAPGTRETDLLRPMHVVEHVDALVLAGGSAFGLAAADGVMRWCEQAGLGYPTPFGRVPIVPAAILYDLSIGESGARPTAEMGWAACTSASSAPVAQGCVGAGTGCTIGKLLGPACATKAGIGSAAEHFSSGLVVAALVAVNALGDVVAPDGRILAGLRTAPNSAEFLSTMDVMRAGMNAAAPGATVIGVIACNARLSRESVNKVAQMAHDGLARAVSPAHTMADGDTLFALASGEVAADVSLVGAIAAEVTARAIREAVLWASSCGGLPALADLRDR